MNCPVCDAKLRSVEKMGVEVDICSDCKGIWLDRGELEKLVELAASDGPNERPRAYRDDEHHHHRDLGRDQRHDSDAKPRKKGSWIADVLGSFGGGED